MWVIDVQSLEAHPVSPEGRQVWGYAWSPDGERIALNTTPTPRVDDRFKQTEVAVVSRKGGSIRTVFHTRGPAEDLVWSAMVFTWPTDPVLGTFLMANTSIVGRWRVAR